MQILVSSIVMVMVFLALFEIFGAVTSLILKLKSSILKNIVIGFFVYYSVFQIIALPMVLTKQSLTSLSTTWLVLLAAVCIVFVICILCKLRKNMGFALTGRNYKPGIYVFFMGIVILFVCYFVVVQNYWGWDTAFYVGNINGSLYTDTMYQFDGNSGLPRKTIDFRYALSMFYMNSAVFCKWTGIAAAHMQKYVMTVLCVLLHAAIMWLIGETVFENEIRKKALFVAVALGLNFFFVSDYTTSQFLLMRSYEAKAFCGSVVIPALFYGLLRLWKDEEKKESWELIFIIMLGSLPVSMSAILIIPALFGIGLLTEFFIYRKFKIIINGIICLIPNGIYLIVYFLYTQDILSIKV